MPFCSLFLSTLYSPEIRYSRPGCILKSPIGAFNTPMSRSHTKAFKSQPLRQDPASKAPLVIPRFRQDCKPQPGKLIWTSCLSLHLQSPHLSQSFFFFFFTKSWSSDVIPISHISFLNAQLLLCIHAVLSYEEKAICLMSHVFQPSIYPEVWDQICRGTHLSLPRLPPLAAPGGSASTLRVHRRASLWRTMECCPLQPQRNTCVRVDHFRQLVLTLNN